MSGMGLCRRDVQGELFEMPEAPRKARLATSPAKPRFTACGSTGGRVLCDDCVMAIHRLGVINAPYPRTVRYRATMPDGTVVRVCDAHRRERMT